MRFTSLQLIFINLGIKVFGINKTYDLLALFIPQLLNRLHFLLGFYFGNQLYILTTSIYYVQQKNK